MSQVQVEANLSNVIRVLIDPHEGHLCKTPNQLFLQLSQYVIMRL